MSILSDIVQSKAEEIVSARRSRPLAEIRSACSNLMPTRDFRGALTSGRPSIIAEIKRASPSRGILSGSFDPGGLAVEYEHGGAAALSVLTDRRYFQGDPNHLKEAKERTSLPVLRKDFILDEYQLYESRVLGADAVLLIATVHEVPVLQDLIHRSRELGLAVITEVHSEPDLEKAVAAGAEIIGVNNRDLADFSISLEVSLRLRPLIPEHITTVSESGITSPDTARALSAAGYHALLIGERLMTAEDKGAVLRSFLLPG